MFGRLRIYLLKPIKAFQAFSIKKFARLKEDHHGKQKDPKAQARHTPA